jgi:putative membrane protein
MVVRPLTDLVRLLPLLAGLLILHSKTGGGLVWGVAAAVLAVASGLVHWATTRYLVTDERVYLRRGLLNTKTLSVARDRIRTVDISAHLLHRVLGVCKVSIGTGRNDLRSSENFHLDGLARSDAESLRTLLTGQVGWVQAGQASSAQAPSAQESVSAGHALPAGQAPAAQERVVRQVGDASGEIVRLRAGWLRFAPLTMAGLVVLGVLFGAVVQITNATDVNLAATGPVRRITADYAALPFGERIVLALAVAIAGYMVVAVAGYIAVYWNFRLIRDGADTLRITRGLLSVRATTISLARLHGVEISEPLSLRAVGGARCVAIATGLRVGRGAEHEGSVLVPPAPSALVTDVAAELLGMPAEICSGPLERHGPAAHRRRYVRALGGAAVIVATAWVANRVTHGPVWIPIVSSVALPLAGLLAADRYRSLGHRLVGGWLVTRVGSLARRRSVLGTDAIIGWRIHQTWFQRRQGLMTLTATTAAGQQHYSVRDVPVALGLTVATTATPDLIRPFLAAKPSRPGT